MGIKVEIDNRGLVQTKTADNEATQFLLYGVPVGSGGGTLNPMSFRKFDDSQAESIEEETLLFNVTSEDFGLDKVLWICPLAENPEVDRIVGLPIAQIGDVITNLIQHRLL